MNIIKSLLSRYRLVRTETLKTVRVVESSELSIMSWRQNPVNVQAASKILNDPVFKSMLILLESESPLQTHTPPNHSDAHHLTRVLGQEEGYRNSLAKLQSFGILHQDTQEPEVEFQSEDAP